MVGLWKTVAAPLLVVVVGAFIISLFQSAEVPTIEAHYSSMEVPSPVSPANLSQLEELRKASKSGLKAANLDALIALASYQRTLRIVTLEISNNGDLRSKEFEAFGRDERALIGIPESDGTMRFEHRGRLKALDPGATVRLLVFAPAWPSVPVTVLHDGRRINLASRELNDVTGYLLEFINEYPALSFIVATVVVIFGVMALILMLVAVWSEFVSPEIRLRMTAAKELSKVLAFADYAKEHDPSKYAEAERLAKISKSGTTTP